MTRSPFLRAGTMLACAVMLAGCAAPRAVVTPGASETRAQISATPSAEPQVASPAASPDGKDREPLLTAYPSPTSPGFISAPAQMEVVPDDASADPNATDGVATVQASLTSDAQAVIDYEADRRTKNPPSLEQARREGLQLMRQALDARGYDLVDPEVYVDSRMVTGPIWYETYNTILMAQPYRYGICEAVFPVPAAFYTTPALLCGTHAEFDKRARQIGVSGPGKPARDLAKEVIAEANMRIDAGADPRTAFADAMHSRGFDVVAPSGFPREPGALASGARLATVDDAGNARAYRLAARFTSDGITVSCIMPISSADDGVHLFLGMKDAPTCQ